MAFSKTKDLFGDWYQQNHFGSPSLKKTYSQFYMERDDRGNPLCFLEVARETQDYDLEFFLTTIPKKSFIPCPCYLVLYSDGTEAKEISGFRVKRIFPREAPFQEMSPRGLIGMIESVKALRKRLVKQGNKFAKI